MVDNNDKPEPEEARKPGEGPKQFKKVNDLAGLPTWFQDFVEDARNKDFAVDQGVAGSGKKEPVPQFNRLPGETVYGSSTNASMVIGPYRPAGRFSKRRARGESGTGTIDLCAGRLGSYATSVLKSGDKETRATCDNNYKVDAARVVISACGDVDQDFGIRPGKVLMSSGRSFVCAKADDIRLSARESIKLVTGTDDENAQGGTVDNPRGIDIIAGNIDEDLQPMTKGHNLVDCIDDINKNMSDLSGALLDFMVQQMLFNMSVMSHSHILDPAMTTAGLAAFATTGVPTPIPSVLSSALLFFNGIKTNANLGTSTFTSIMNNRLNITRNYFKYLVPKPFNPDKYICSKFNNVN